MERKLNYFKDGNGDYIIRRISGLEPDESYFLYNGDFSSIYIIKKENMEEKIAELFESISDDIENIALKNFKIKKESIIFEKISGNFIEEKEYNPLFKNLSEEEALELCKDSIKVKIYINFEMNIKLEKHLKFKAFMNFITGKSQNRN